MQVGSTAPPMSEQPHVVSPYFVYLSLSFLLSLFSSLCLLLLSYSLILLLPFFFYVLKSALYFYMFSKCILSLSLSLLFMFLQCVRVYFFLQKQGTPGLPIPSAFQEAERKTAEQKASISSSSSPKDSQMTLDERDQILSSMKDPVRSLSSSSSLRQEPEKKKQAKEKKVLDFFSLCMLSTQICCGCCIR